MGISKIVSRVMKYRNKSDLQKLIKVAYNEGMYGDKLVTPTLLKLYAEKHAITIEELNELEQLTHQELIDGKASIRLSRGNNQKLMLSMVKVAIKNKLTSDDDLMDLEKIGFGLDYSHETISWLITSIKSKTILDSSAKVTYDLVHYILKQNNGSVKAA